MNAPRLIEGDCLIELPKLASAGERFHAVITDPPYHLTTNKPGGTGIASLNVNSPAGRSRIGTGFMGKAWDSGDIAFRLETWRAVYDVLLPGGYMVCFASTRGYHRMVCAIEDAGFIIHPMIAWVTSQGFPKATDVSRMIDKQAGAEGEIIGPATYTRGATEMRYSETRKVSYDCQPQPLTASATPEAAQWEGWKYGLQSLKPAIEPICLAQKPPEKGGMIQNILKHDTGALNIQACRIPSEGGRLRKGEASQERRYSDRGAIDFAATPGPRGGDPTGRWPANLVHDGSLEVLAAFAAFGDAPGQQRTVGPEHGAKTSVHCYGDFGPRETFQPHGDSGTAARFFTQCLFTEDELRFHYSGKANRTADRADSSHPTIKPQSLLSWLCKFITPPGGHIIDHFAGSGSTAEACMLLGFDCTLIERDSAYAEDIRHRIKRWSGMDTPLFAEPTS